MNREHYEQYLSSLMVIKQMLNLGLLSDKEYNESENLLANKYCINKGNLYRQNNLIIKDFRVIYVMENKDVQHGNENY